MRGIDTLSWQRSKYLSTRSDNSRHEQVKSLSKKKTFVSGFSDVADHAPKTHGRGYEDGTPRTIKKRNLSFIHTKKELSKWLPYSISLTSSGYGDGGKCFHEYHSRKADQEDIQYQDAYPLRIFLMILWIQTESEVLGELNDQKISEMGQSVLKHFQSLEIEYINQGQQHQKNRRLTWPSKNM